MKNLIFRYCTSATSEKIIPRWEQDYRLQPFAKLGLFYEYLEMGKRRTVPHFQLHTQLLDTPSDKGVSNTLVCLTPLSENHVQEMFEIFDIKMRVLSFYAVKLHNCNYTVVH